MNFFLKVFYNVNYSFLKHIKIASYIKHFLNFKLKFVLDINVLVPISSLTYQLKCLVYTLYL